MCDRKMEAWKSPSCRGDLDLLHGRCDSYKECIGWNDGNWSEDHTHQDHVDSCCLLDVNTWWRWIWSCSSEDQNRKIRIEWINKMKKGGKNELFSLLETNYVTGNRWLESGIHRPITLKLGAFYWTMKERKHMIISEWKDDFLILFTWYILCSSLYFVIFIWNGDLKWGIELI